MKLCAHLGYQFNEFDGLNRLDQAAKAGFSGVEWPAIYGFKSSDLIDRVNECNLEWAQVTLPTGNATSNEKGLTALPGREREFSDNLHQAIEYAKKLGSKAIHPMSGANISLSDARTYDTYIKNLQLALAEAKKNQLTVLIEVIGQQTAPGYAMSDYTIAKRVFQELPDLRLIFDSYHAQTLHGNPADLAHEWGELIGHVQIADVPGRNEPGTGNINFQELFDTLKQHNYKGFVGCEYKPKGGTLEGLHYLRTVRKFL
jgi:hydroxypyruvate isomerase